MNTYYRVIKDTPSLRVGAILGNLESATTYSPIGGRDIWNKRPDGSGVSYIANVIEHAPDFFQRVYQLDNGRYGTLEQALAEADSKYIGDTKPEKK